MNTKKSFPWYLVAMVAGGILLASSNAQIPEFNWRDWFKAIPTPIVNTNLEGTTLLLIHEKTRPTVQEVFDVRAAAEFASKNKLKGYLDVDKDADWIKPTIDAVKEKPGLEPPMLLAVKIEDNKVKSVVKARKWTNSIEDILK